MNNPRLVRVKDELGYFHGWEQSDSQTSQTYGIVEFENRIPSYLDAQIVLDDIEIKLDKTIKVPLNKNGNEVV